MIDYVVGTTPPGKAIKAVKAVKAGKARKKSSERIEDIYLDEWEVEHVNSWVESTRDIGTKENLADVLKSNPLIKKHSIKYLRDNDLIDKDNNVTLYRYLNIAESNKLKPDKGLTSTTLNPDHAKKMAIKQAEVTGGVLKPGQKADFFDSLDPFTAAGKYETKTLVRQPVVLEYKIPVEKVDAYMPALYRNLDENSKRGWRRFQADANYSHLMDDMVDDGYEYYDALDEVAESYTVTSDFDGFEYTAFDESEIIADLTNIKPSNMFVDKKAIDTIADLSTKAYRKLATGGAVDIELYQKELDELEDYISSNRLVSKEAQMSLLSGEGYKDPRFTVSFDNPIIDKFALHPLAAAGSGYQPTSKELGIDGYESILNPQIGGQYSESEDVVMFKDPNKGIPLLSPDVLKRYLDTLGKKSVSDLKTSESIQKHELIHRAVRQSGYLDFLPTSEFLKENSTTKYLKGNAAIQLTNVINEALAESYEDTGDLKSRIKFRVDNFNINEDKKQEIADALFKNIEVLRKDFETYLESQMNPDELKAYNNFNIGGAVDIDKMLAEL